MANPSKTTITRRATGAGANRGIVPTADPATLPDEYALEVSGDCLEPAIPHGSLVHCDKNAPIRSGDLVILFLRPEFLAPGEHPVRLKRVVFPVPDYVTELPYQPHPNSTVMPMIVVEQDKPSTQFWLTLDKVQAVHRCYGEIAPKNVTASREERGGAA